MHYLFVDDMTYCFWMCDQMVVCVEYDMIWCMCCLHVLYNMTWLSLCVREGKQSAQRKRSYGSPLVSIAEREETECREGLEPDAAERITNSPNSTTDNIEVRGITVHRGTKLMYIFSMSVCIILQSILLNIETEFIVVTQRHLWVSVKPRVMLHVQKETPNYQKRY